MNQNSSNSTLGTDKTNGNDKAARALEATITGSASQLTKEAKHIAGDLAGQAKKSGEAQIAGRKDRAAQGLGGLADALRQTGDTMKSQEDENPLSEYVVRASDKVEEASRYLERRSVRQIIGDVEGFARREPALFLGGAFVVGLLGGRFLKSSRPAPKVPRRDGMRLEPFGNRQTPGDGTPRQFGASGQGQSAYGQSAYGQSAYGQSTQAKSDTFGTFAQGQSQTLPGQGPQTKDTPADAGKPTPVTGGGQKPGAM